MECCLQFPLVPRTATGSGLGWLQLPFAPSVTDGPTAVLCASLDQEGGVGLAQGHSQVAVSLSSASSTLVLFEHQ